MHSVKLNIEDSIYEQFINFIKILPNDKVEILGDFEEFPSPIGYEQAKQKVDKALKSNKTYSEEETFKILEKELNV